MKTLAAESLIIRVVDYNPTKLIIGESVKVIILRTVQFYPRKKLNFKYF